MLNPFFPAKPEQKLPIVSAPLSKRAASKLFPFFRRALSKYSCSAVMHSQVPIPPSAGSASFSPLKIHKNKCMVENTEDFPSCFAV